MGTFMSRQLEKFNEQETAKILFLKSIKLSVSAVMCTAKVFKYC